MIHRTLTLPFGISFSKMAQHWSAEILTKLFFMNKNMSKSLTNVIVSQHKKNTKPFSKPILKNANSPLMQRQKKKAKKQRPLPKTKPMHWHNELFKIANVTNQKIDSIFFTEQFPCAQRLSLSFVT